MPCARGALPGYASEFTRQHSVPRRTAEGWTPGASLRVEKRTVHDLLSGTHNDLLTSCEKNRPPLHRGGTTHCCRTRENGEAAKRTFPLDSAGGIPTATHGERARRRAQKATRMTLEFLQKKNCRGEVAKHSDLGAGYQLWIGTERRKRTNRRAVCERISQEQTEAGGARDGKPT